MANFKEEWRKAPIADSRDMKCCGCNTRKDIRIFERKVKQNRGDEIHVAGCVHCAGPWVQTYGYVACMCPELENVKREP
jgi:hypothetical protein